MEEESENLELAANMGGVGDEDLMKIIPVHDGYSYE